MQKIKVVKNSNGFIDCYTEIRALNDFPGVRGNINNDFINDLISVFESYYGVVVKGMPMSTQIGIYNISNEDGSLQNAQKIIGIINELLINPPDRVVTKAEIDYKNAQEMHEKKESGQYFKDKRTIREQKMVDHAFNTLKSKGAVPWEYDVNYFMIRNLKRGLFKNNYENIQGAEELFEFSKKYTPK